VRIVSDATLAFIKRRNVLSAIIEMAFGNQNSIQSMEKSGVTSTEEGKASEKQHQVTVDLFLCSEGDYSETDAGP
jgi:hypothetical protein